jgi:hypothetical protein
VELDGALDGTGQAILSQTGDSPVHAPNGVPNEVPRDHRVNDRVATFNAAESQCQKSVRQWHRLNDDDSSGAADVASALESARRAVQSDGAQGRGVTDNKHPTDFESLPPPPHNCMSTHPEGKSCC